MGLNTSPPLLLQTGPLHHKNKIVFYKLQSPTQRCSVQSRRLFEILGSCANTWLHSITHLRHNCATACSIGIPCIFIFLFTLLLGLMYNSLVEHQFYINQIEWCLNLLMLIDSSKQGSIPETKQMLLLKWNQKNFNNNYRPISFNQSFSTQCYYYYSL